MGLVNLKTDLKSLKYGNDRPGGGSSNQPYIVTPIPNGLTANSPDFLLRQGALKAALTDQERLTKFFLDFNSPRGALFTAKQIALERQNPAIPGGLIRAYLPTSTLSQVLLSPEGVHLNKQGIDPFELSYAQGGTGGYFNYTLNKSIEDNTSRLSLLYDSKISSATTINPARLREFHISLDPEYSISYNGGPDSIGGIGRTRIKLAGNGNNSSRDRTNTYKLQTQSDIEGVFTFDNDEFSKKNPFTEKLSSTLTDFRTIINAANPNANLPETPYETFNRENTYGTSKTEYRLSRENKEKRRNPNNSINPDIINQLDVLNSGTNSTEITEYQNKDLVSFYFEILNATASSNSTIQSDFLFFRAYITDLGDNYKADWQNYKYIGRAENFYKYGGFSRDVSLGFTVYAHSRAEMVPLYNKLNYLAGVTAPTYSGQGLMMGNIVKLTVGNYFNQMPGIINSVNLKPNFEAGWDINRKENGDIFNNITDVNNVGQLPRMIDVTLSFTPIHKFVPQYASPFINDRTAAVSDALANFKFPG
jgi:hypothetical protein